MGDLYLDIWIWIPGSGQPPGDPILFLIWELNFWRKYIYISLWITSHVLIWGVCLFLDIWIRTASRWYNFIFDIKIEILSPINVWIDFLILGGFYLDIWTWIWIWTTRSGQPPWDQILIIFSKLYFVMYLEQDSLQVNRGWGIFF